MDELELVELGADRSLTCAELQTRADQNTWSEYRLQFVATIGEMEVAFVSFDLTPGADYLLLYELFVATAQRGRGLGGALVERAEAIAKGRGLRLLLVLPRSLTEGVSDEWLRGWYGRRGFRPWSEDPDLLAKDVSRIGS